MPNPLQVWPALLDEFGTQQVSTIHGDLNMGNILVDVKFGVTYIIDGAHARTDAVLYDLLRLEMDAVLHHLPAVLFKRKSAAGGYPQPLLWRALCCGEETVCAGSIRHSAIAQFGAGASLCQSGYAAQDGRRLFGEPQRLA